MSIDYTAILLRRYPGTRWTLNGEEYDGLTWLDSSAKPTKDELDSLWQFVQQEIADEAAAKIARIESARTKLAALGLDADEVSALFGF